MKIYISADIEGVTGVTHWDEADRLKPDYNEFREQMTAEVSAACEGALLAGATEIWIKDAHASARNLIAARLPKQTHLIRGWSGHPFSMVQELDESFQAMLMVGYHSRAGSGANPLAHTISGNIAGLKINGSYASELLMHAYTAAYVNVPLVFVSGDEGLCEDITMLIPQITTVAVKRGVGDASINIHPHLAVEQISERVQTALQEDISKCRLSLPEYFEVQITYRDHAMAHRASFFPAAVLEQPHTIGFESDDYFEVLRLFSFVLFS
jgi:D-amino peptidase